MRSAPAAGRGFALLVASVGLTAAVVVVAAIWPSPDRHVHGLLVVISLTLVLGVAGGGLRVVAASRGREASDGGEQADAADPRPGGIGLDGIE
ncbi:putative secreted protein [Candidatus Protofrankia californiensis]|uniref:Putative secreted protein n=1 Tax=Candidatus Protofrankia californiensis TaxID=1839754 RepID=A0A1C3PH70_9ACTN|nr:putative secreted protein [Candidatus Protofrankia californiensis]